MISSQTNGHRVENRSFNQIKPRILHIKVIPHLATGYEPFHALYRQESCLTAVQKAVQAGQRRMTDWFLDVKVRAMEEDEIRVYDPDFLSFTNLNTLAELQQAEELARSLEGG